MKRLSILKIIQLAVLTALSVGSIFFLLSPDMKKYVFASTPATVLFVIVWALLAASYIFLLFDFSFISTLKFKYHNLFEVAYSDPLSGIPNRFSCDVLIEKYADIELPDSVGCIMVDLTNLPEINSLYDHATGNKLLKQFSNILSSSALSLCFVGRNGGNKFLAIFEDCTPGKFDSFLNRVKAKVRQHNTSPDALPLEYRVGCALNTDEHLTQITQLISLANHRIYSND